MSQGRPSNATSSTTIVNGDLVVPRLIPRDEAQDTSVDMMPRDTATVLHLLNEIGNSDVIELTRQLVCVEEEMGGNVKVPATGMWRRACFVLWGTSQVK